MLVDDLFVVGVVVWVGLVEGIEFVVGVVVIGIVLIGIVLGIVWQVIYVVVDGLVVWYGCLGWFDYQGQQVLGGVGIVVIVLVIVFQFGGDGLYVFFGGQCLWVMVVVEVCYQWWQQQGGCYG